MSSNTSKITVVEDFRDKDGGPIWHNTPVFAAPIYPTQAEFIFKASKVLSDFRKKWLEEHEDDSWARGIEMDIVPVTTDGMIMGFMVASEINPDSYDYVPSDQKTPEEADPDRLRDPMNQSRIEGGRAVRISEADPDRLQAELR